MNANMISRHAAARASQRGVPNRLIEAVLSFSDCEAEVGSACLALRISRRRLADPGVRAALGADVDRLAGLSLIVAGDTGTVVTVFHDLGGRKGLRYRRCFRSESRTRQPRAVRVARNLHS